MAYGSSIRVGQKVDYREKGVCIHLMLPAYFADAFFSKAQGDAEAAHDKHHRIVFADQVAHFVILLIYSICVHSDGCFY